MLGRLSAPGRRAPRALALGLLTAALGPIATAAADSGGLFLGHTSQRQPIAVRIAQRGGYVVRLHVAWRARCTTGATLDGVSDQTMFAVDQFGVFRLRGSYRIALAGGRHANVIAAQRGRGVGTRTLRGIFRAYAVVRSARGVTVDRCETGTLGYVARLKG